MPDSVPNPVTLMPSPMIYLKTKPADCPTFTVFYPYKASY